MRERERERDRERRREKEREREREKEREIEGREKVFVEITIYSVRDPSTKKMLWNLW